jgi:hypothetical protein
MNNSGGISLVLKVLVGLSLTKNCLYQYEIYLANIYHVA